MYSMTLDIAEREAVEARIGEDTNLLLLTHVHYKSAARFDMGVALARGESVDEARRRASEAAARVRIDYRS